MRTMTASTTRLTRRIPTFSLATSAGEAIYFQLPVRGVHSETVGRGGAVSIHDIRHCEPPVLLRMWHEGRDTAIAHRLAIDLQRRRSLARSVDRQLELPVSLAL